mgnify:FL=1
MTRQWKTYLELGRTAYENVGQPWGATDEDMVDWINSRLQMPRIAAVVKAELDDERATATQLAALHDWLSESRPERAREQRG